MPGPFLSSRRRLLAGGLGLAAGAAALSGCGARPAAGGGTSPKPRTVPSTDAAGKVTISFLQAMSSGARKAALAKLTNDFMAANPDIVVQLWQQPDHRTLRTKISELTDAGKPPTIAEVEESWAEEYAEAKTIVPLDAYIAKAQQYEDFYDGIKADLQLPDQLTWMWPFSKSVVVMYYNTDLVPRPPRTWDEFARVAAAVSKGTVTALSIDPGSVAAPAGGTVLLEILAQAFGNPVFALDGAPQFTQPSVVKALRYLAGLKRTGALALGRDGPGRRALADRTGAFDISGTECYPDNLQAIGRKFRMGVAELPTGPAGRSGNQLAGSNIVLFAAAGHDQKAAAWKYLQFLTDPARQAYWSARTGYLPVCQQATLQKTFKEYAARAPFVTGATQQLNSATPLPPVRWCDVARGYLSVAIEQSVARGADPAAALRSAQMSAERARKRG